VSRSRPSHHGSPLRYPGGKAKLAPFFKSLLRQNRLLDCTYVEPFAGGGGVALSLLLHGYVNDIVLNDLSAPIYSFWVAMLKDPQRFEREILEVPLTVTEWENQRAIFRSGDAGSFELGFSAFYLNRTNHSGVLNGGMIGGYSQKSKYGLDARFNRQELAARVQRIAKLRDKILVTNLDAIQLLGSLASWCEPALSLLYIDPPYFTKGRDLYYDYYTAEDHTRLSECIFDLGSTTHWIVSYDNVPAIRSLYERAASLTYTLSYSVRNGRNGDEVIFLSDNLDAPLDLPSVAPVSDIVAKAEEHKHECERVG
jgi:DNA adenine methylase